MCRSDPPRSRVSSQRTLRSREGNSSQLHRVSATIKMPCVDDRSPGPSSSSAYASSRVRRARGNPRRHRLPLLQPPVRRYLSRLQLRGRHRRVRDLQLRLAASGNNPRRAERSTPTSRRRSRSPPTAVCSGPSVQARYAFGRVAGPGCSRACPPSRPNPAARTASEGCSDWRSVLPSRATVTCSRSSPVRITRINT